MTRNVTITLPDELAEQADSLGLLTPEAVETLIAAEVRRRAWDRLHDMMERLAAVDEPTLSEAELEAEIDAARAERRAKRAAGD
jgi:post-segregation antitoxin (ccd killing protein)